MTDNIKCHPEAQPKDLFHNFSLLIFNFKHINSSTIINYSLLIINYKKIALAARRNGADVKAK